MPELTVKSFAKYKDLFGADKKIDVPLGGTITDALILFAGQVPKAQTELFENGRLKSSVVLMYNNERIDFEDADTITLEDGDELVLYPPVSGG